MKTISKRMIALACAAVLAVGGLVTASAGASTATDSNSGSKLRGSAARTSSTSVSATSAFISGTAPITDLTVSSRAYIVAGGVKQYGSRVSRQTATVTATASNMAGVGTTGYGGEHSATFIVHTSSGTVSRSLVTTSSY